MLKLHLVKEPRSIILSSNEYSLVFRQPLNNSSKSVLIDFVPADEVDLSDAIVLYETKKVAGVLGILEIGGETFLSVITSASTLGTNNRSLKGIGTETISCVLSVEFPCLSSNIFDSFTSFDVDPYDDTTSISRGPGDVVEHPCAGVRRILSNGHFYFSNGENAADLTTTVEKRLERDQMKLNLSEEDAGNEEEYNPRFLWNTFLISPLLSFRASLNPTIRQDFDPFIALVIQGYCGVYDLSIGGEPAVLSVISRNGWARGGTRFNVRGVDDLGNTANFVETETILRTPSMCFSYLQIRGSVPVFWEETGNPFGLKITVTRPMASSMPAFLKHFETLLKDYSSVHILNLLSSKDQEAALTESYQAHLSAAKAVDGDIREKVYMTNFDFHARSRMGGMESIKGQLASSIGQVAGELGSSLMSVDSTGRASLIVAQAGVFRTNCKDCLDRSGVAQDILSRFALEDFIRNANPHWSGSDLSLFNAHRVLFADNGDALSKMYVGTGALNTSFSRSGKKSFAGLLSDASKSVGRMYQSTFLDSSKQASIDALLGQLSTSQKVRVFNPRNDAIRTQLNSRSAEFTAYQSISLFVGTWNLNGKGPSSESILPWLFPVSSEEPDLFVLGFQELVPLTPQMIMATDPEKKRRWEASILETLANRPNKKSEYILLRSGQLVGTALIVLLKAEVVKDVRNIEVSTKKTGLKGMAGNKGAIAVRLDYRDTSFCFITAHLAAGHSNIDERNSDYFTISEGLQFSKGKNIASHDNIIWAADTNYRISLSNEEARRLALEDDYASLLEADQLIQSMRTRNIWAGFSEGPLLFRPTYKYDNGTQTYDSSEKQRIPAWTDRILYSGQDLDLVRYGRAELLASDHRPVYSTLRARIKILDQAKKAALRKILSANLKIDSTVDSTNDKMLSQKLNAVTLPSPSDDDQAWYDDVGLPPNVNLRNPAVSNPFEDDYLLPSSQPYNARIPPRPAYKAVPPLPPRNQISTETTRSTLQPPLPRRPDVTQRFGSTNTNSTGGNTLLDEEEEGNLKNWEVIKA